MTSKTFFRLMLLVIALTASLVIFSGSASKSTSPSQEHERICDDNKFQENQSVGDLLIWESLVRNLLSVNN